jgi:hypothetical protein
MALSDTSKINIALKKVQGKAQTSNTKEVSNESIGSNVSIAATTVFGDTLPTATSSSFYTILGGVAEMIRFTAVPIDGTKDSSGLYQAFALQLPSDYQANSSNARAGSGVYVNDQVLTGTNGTLQVIPPTFGASYTALAYHTASSTTTQIAALDGRDWILDYYNGVFFQQDPPADTDEDPVYVDAFLYIGDYVGARLTGSGGGAGIFTVIDGSNASVTSSLNIGGTTAPLHKLVVSGTLSSSVHVSASAFYGIGMVLGGGMSLNRTAVTTHMTASQTDYYLGVDSSSTAITVHLPNAATLAIGQTYVIKDETGNASTNNITISASGVQTIDGQNSIVLISPYSAISLYCNGTNKFFIY